MTCCGAELGPTPGEMWACEANAWAEEQHPFMACLERQHERRLLARVVEGAAWL